MDDDSPPEDRVFTSEAHQVILYVHHGPPVLPRYEVAEVPNMSVLSTSIIPASILSSLLLLLLNRRRRWRPHTCLFPASILSSSQLTSTSGAPCCLPPGL